MKKVLNAFTILLLLFLLTKISQGTEKNSPEAQRTMVQHGQTPRLYQKGAFQSNSPDILKKIELKWEYNSHSSIMGGASLGLNGYIYINLREHFSAIDQAGIEIFNIQTPYSYNRWAPSIGKSGQVYLIIRNFHLQVFSPLGLLEWERGVPYAQNPPALDNDENFYYCGGYYDFYGPPNTKLTQISKSGTILREWELVYPAMLTPCLGQNGRIFCVLEDIFTQFRQNYPALFCLSPDEQNWTVFLDGLIQYVILDNSGNIYITFLNETKKLSYLIAYDSRGIIKWRYPIYVSTAPVIGVDGTIYFGAGNKLMALNPDGTLKWEQEFATQGLNDPTIGADNILYVGSWDSHMYAVHPDGTLAWQFEANDGIEGPPIISPEGLLVFCTGNKVYGIQTTSQGLARSAWPTRGHDNQRTYNLNNPISYPANSEIGINNLLSVYPNPSTGHLNLEFQSKTGGKLELAIYNVLGQKIRTLDQMFLSINQATHSQHDFNDLANGYYFISANQNGKIVTRKFLLMK